MCIGGGRGVLGIREILKNESGNWCVLLFSANEVLKTTEEGVRGAQTGCWTGLQTLNWGELESWFWF